MEIASISVDDTRFFPILFGGDQMTVARVNGVQLLRVTEAKRADRYEGIVLIIEDWHTRMTIMKVKHYILDKYSVKSNNSKNYFIYCE